MIGYGPYVDQCADLLDGQEVVRGAHGRGDGARDRGGGAGPSRRARRARVLGRRGRPRHGRPHARALGRRSPRPWAARPARAALAAPGDEVVVIPGVTAALAVAARVGRAAGGRLGDALALGPPPPVGDGRAAAHGARCLWHRARALQPALAHADRAVRARARDPPRAPRRSTRRRSSPPTSRRAGESILEHDARRGSTPRRVTMRSLVLVAGETAEWAGTRLDREARMTVHLVGAGPGDPRLLTVAAARSAAATRGWSSTTGRRWTRSSRSRRRRRERHCVGRAPGQQGAAAGRGQRAADRARPATATSCGSRAATRSWPRAAAEEARRAHERGDRRQRRPRRLRRARRSRRGGHPADAAPALGHRDVRRRQRRRRARRAAGLGRARPPRRDARDPHRPRADPARSPPR